MKRMSTRDFSWGVVAGALPTILEIDTYADLTWVMVSSTCLMMVFGGAFVIGMALKSVGSSDG